MGESDVVTEKKSKQMKSYEYNRIADEDRNPCLKESDMTRNCMDRHSYDKDKCTEYFMNYRNCVSFWSKIRGDRVQKGIKPYMPTKLERDQIKKERRLGGGQ